MTTTSEYSDHNLRVGGTGVRSWVSVLVYDLGYQCYNGTSSMIEGVNRTIRREGGTWVTGTPFRLKPSVWENQKRQEDTNRVGSF